MQTRQILSGIFLALGVSLSAAQAQNVDAGAAVFKKCSACHKVGDGARNGAGPVLTDVIGRIAGTYEGFKFGKSIVQAGAAGLVWDQALVADYVADPKKFLRAYLGDKKAKAKMRFKLKKEQDRLDVAAYLASFVVAETQGSSETTPAQGTTLAALATPANTICVQNASTQVYFFAVEAGEGTRMTKTLAAGDVLCTEATDTAVDGMVSVFPEEDTFEGCSRLVPSGVTEKMMKYADFDRCRWSSNNS
jgi:cytochrome c2